MHTIHVGAERFRKVGFLFIFSRAMSVCAGSSFLRILENSPENLTRF